MHRTVMAVISTVTLCLAARASAGLHDDMTVDVLHATEAGAADRFGKAVAVSGDLCVIGAAESDELGGNNAGSAYVFRHDGNRWVAEAKLTASNGDSNDQFGSAVAVSKGRIVIGAKKHDAYGSNAGIVYGFEQLDDNWIEASQLAAPDIEAGDQFGSAVSISGSTILVGSKGDDDLGTSSGSIHFFDWSESGWVHAQKLTASDAGASWFFGRAIALSGDVAIAGAYGDDALGSDLGSAYVFRRSEQGWSEEQKLTADVSEHALFGWSVGLSGNLAVVGAPEDDMAAPDGGTVHAYRYDAETQTWSQEALLVAADAVEDDRFGCAVAIGENVISVGSPLRDGEFPDAGAVFLFRHDGNGWTEDAVLVPPTPYFLDEFGSACAFSGNTLVVGTPEDDDLGNNSGSASIFRFAGIEPCAGDFDGSGMVDYSDVFIMIDAWGLCDGCPQDLNGDGEVGQSDLVLLIGLWGPCD